VNLSGWGRFPRIDCRVLHVRDSADVETAIQREPSLIARGNGRAYGDAALNPRATLLMRRLERLIDFDPNTGLLVCEAGTLLADIIALFVPRGWFPPVTPGTKYVTVGGMVAADIHGKNHHIAGSFGRHVVWIDLALADGRTLRCSHHEHADLFAATIGGMGLTGIILRVAFPLIRIETDLIRQTTMKASNLEEAMIHFEENAGATYSVAWTDCLAGGDRLGRSLVFLGEHAARDDLPRSAHRTAFAANPRRALRVPFDFPSFTLNGLSIAAFNELYYRYSKAGSRFVNLESYFYPLDAIADWNRMYGARGFLQYQFVMPKPASFAGISAVLRRVAKHNAGSFLAVLKLFGPQNGLMSFAMEGYTLSLDFPVNRRNLALLPELDAVVADHNGRLYLAKDARARADMFTRGYPALATFAAIRARVDPTRRLASLQSERLSL
jgi:decaprenylphospho-beta-D-ribofuranose 2-oxidase